MKTTAQAVNGMRTHEGNSRRRRRASFREFRPMHVIPTAMENTMDEMTVDQWLALRKEAAFKMDPETAEVFWHWAQVLDPYEVGDGGPEVDCVGRVYFARAP